MKKSVAIIGIVFLAAMLARGQAKIAGTATLAGTAKLQSGAGGGGGPNTWTFRQYVSTSPAATNPLSLPAFTSVLANDLLVVGIEVEGGSTAVTISAVSGGCAGTWTHVASSNIYSGTSRSIDFYYCNNAAAGSNVVVQITATGTFASGLRGDGWRATPSTGASDVDVVGTRTDTTNNPAPGISLALTSTDFVVSTDASSGSTSSMTAGNGCTQDLINSGHGAAHCSASASAAYPVSWGLSATSVILSAVAFK